MDAGKLVLESLDWKTVPRHERCKASSSSIDEPTILPLEAALYEIDASECAFINYLEHVQVDITLESESRRGDFMVMLRSPSGTLSTLLTERRLDDQRFGYQNTYPPPHFILFLTRNGFEDFENMPLTSVHFWGEGVSNGNSTWKVFISNAGESDATVSEWAITFYGTLDDPQPGKENLNFFTRQIRSFMKIFFRKSH